MALCTLLLLSACSFNKVSPATLALQAELEEREQQLLEQQEALEEERDELKKRAAKVKLQKKKNERAEKRLRNEERLLEHRLAAARRAAPVAPVKQTDSGAARLDANLLLVGSTEKLVLSPPDISLTGRMDTGAKRCMLEVFDLNEFERDGEPHVRFSIKPEEKADKIEVTRPVKHTVRFREINSNGKRRPVVMLRVVLGSIEEQVEFVLVENNKTDVSEVSIGRNLLRDLAVVDVSKSMLIKTPAK